MFSQEIRSQLAFRQDRARHFVGRVDDLQAIQDYITQSTSTRDRLPLAIVEKASSMDMASSTVCKTP